MEVKNLTFGYGDTPVLRDISFKVEEGKITTLLGANGCGKSTLFYLMTKNLMPDSGSILLNGTDIRSWGFGILQGRSPSFIRTTRPVRISPWKSWWATAARLMLT